MARKSKIQIKESTSELKSLYKKEENFKIRQRILCLSLIKSQKIKKQEAIAIHIGVNYATVKRWLKQYREEGISSLLSIKSGGNKQSIITPSIHQSLSKKLNNPKNPLRGYWDVVIWLKENHNLDIEYHTVRSYLIRHFKTKIKSPRKSHYKKDESAIIAFKKTP